jgi:hypothetical protein
VESAGTLPCVPELDTIIERSLRLFYEDICTLPEWYGRENEMVNLYAWNHLAKQVGADTILRDACQIGIEVAVQQLPKEVLLKWNPKVQRPKKDVRKDLVIWPSARMCLWKDKESCNEPLAIMEWKVNHFRNRAAHPKNLRDYPLDVNWLRETSLREGMGNFIGYAVLLENTRTPKTLTCMRVQAGAEWEFLRLPEATSVPSL